MEVRKSPMVLAMISAVRMLLPPVVTRVIGLRIESS